MMKNDFISCKWQFAPLQSFHAGERKTNMRYLLKNERLKLIFDTLGGTLTSFQADGTEYLWQGDPAFWSGQSPVMFPICGSLNGDAAEICGSKICTMGRHGFARSMEFECAGAGDESIAFTLSANQETLKKYPCDFRLTIRYDMLTNGIRFCYDIENRGKERMPFFVGGHPAFRCPISQGENYSDYEIEFEKKETADCACLWEQNRKLLDAEHKRRILDDENHLTLSHELFRDDALVFDSLRSRSLRYQNRKTGQGLKVDFSDFPYLVLWSSDNGGNFIAIEPWLGLPDRSDNDGVFEHKENVQYAEPGETKHYSFTVTVLDN